MSAVVLDSFQNFCDYFYLGACSIHVSAEQLAQAKPHPKVQYGQVLAEEIPCADHSIDLISVAQAAHRLNLENSMQKLRQLLNPMPFWFN